MASSLECRKDDSVVFGFVGLIFIPIIILSAFDSNNINVAIEIIFVLYLMLTIGIILNLRKSKIYYKGYNDYPMRDKYDKIKKVQYDIGMIKMDQKLYDYIDGWESAESEFEQHHNEIKIKKLLQKL